MAKIESGCCLASQAIEQSKDCEKRIDSLVASSSSDAQRIAVLEDKVSGLTAVIVCCVIISASVFTASFYAVDQSKQRLQRIEKIVGIDEIGRRK